MLTPFYNNWIYRAEMNPHNFHSNRRSNTQAPCALVGMVGKSKCTYIYIYVVWSNWSGCLGSDPKCKKTKLFSHEFLARSTKEFLITTWM